jgi:transcriptional regulator with XRE-family HTH domain
MHVAAMIPTVCIRTMSADETPGDRVKAIRKALGLTQEEVAARAGIRRDAVVKVESGANQAGSAAIRSGLARAFGLTLDDVASVLEGRLDAEGAVRRARGELAPVVPITAAAAPRSETRVVYDDEDALEQTITQALDPARGHLLRDARAVQEAMHPLRFKRRDDVPGVVAVRGWLDAAAALRRRGEPVTAAALLVMVSSGDVASDRAKAWQDEAREASERADRG